MFYVPDGTKLCGYYECTICKYRFLSLSTAPFEKCPDCDEDVDLELGPDDPMPEEKNSAKLISICQGEEEVEKMDALLSLAITGGNFDWL